MLGLAERKLMNRSEGSLIIMWIEMNEKLFWKKMSKMDGVKVRNCTRIKDRNGWLVLEEQDSKQRLMNCVGSLY